MEDTRINTKKSEKKVKKVEESSTGKKKKRALRKLENHASMAEMKRNRIVTTFSKEKASDTIKRNSK